MNQKFENSTYFIESLKAGDEEAYSYLVDKFDKRLFVYALSLVKDIALAQDIVQNVFLNVWIYREKLNSDSSIQNFLYTSTYNNFTKLYWKNKSTKNLKEKYAQALNEVVEETDEEAIKKLMIIVTEEIDNLPRKCKEVFLLSKTDGLSNIEISEYLNISLKTVESHITKAYTIIRERIDDKTHFVLFLLFKQIL
ncbi:sigma-70 family RNA polymerase sigma factor [Gelidibacter salicanalis]|uniref:Sigma-70 family RNA polymerase sigma factor n=1 Tax=Gelidibacter salicanalis TaxID=291193 RepID=A0A5C7AKD2_9FLAO|nr:sigma-70 family RNA polymerase sigma factor [Gelidibacter salicanalis]TXE08384.1 sigma-70 family RNA polymerase sigma factor [Gelidibacter salicanalis]